MMQNQTNQTKGAERFRKINSLILNNDRFLVVADVGSFDSVAAATSLAILLQSLKKDVTLYSADKIKAENFPSLKGIDNFVSELNGNGNKLLITFNSPLNNIERVSSNDEGEKLNLIVEFKEGAEAIDPSQVEVKTGKSNYHAGFIIGSSLGNESELTKKGQWVWVARQGGPQAWAEVNIVETKATLSESVASFISRAGFDIPTDTVENLYFGIKKGTNNFTDADSIALETAAYCLRVKEDKSRQQGEGGKIPQTPIEAVEAKEGGSAPSEWQKPPIFTGTTTPKV